MKVTDLMTTPVFTLRLDKKLFIAGQIMGWAHIRHVPVIDRRNRLVGMISHSGINVREIMQTRVRTIGAEASVQQAASLMRGGKFGCLPLVNQDARTPRHNHRA